MADDKIIAGARKIPEFMSYSDEEILRKAKNPDAANRFLTAGEKAAQEFNEPLPAAKVYGASSKYDRDFEVASDPYGGGRTADEIESESEARVSAAGKDLDNAVVDGKSGFHDGFSFLSEKDIDDFLGDIESDEARKKFGTGYVFNNTATAGKLNYLVDQGLIEIKDPRLKDALLRQQAEVGKVRTYQDERDKKLAADKSVSMVREETE